jgi:hypothetical protein
MPRVLSYVLGGSGVVGLALIATACSHANRPVTEVGWGSEASRFFDELALAQAGDDLYGTLNFYASSATIDMSRAELSGEVAVVDRLGWNSGDPSHEVLAVSHQMVHDLGGALARGLRTLLTSTGVARQPEFPQDVEAPGWLHLDLLDDAALPGSEIGCFLADNLGPIV